MAARKKGAYRRRQTPEGRRKAENRHRRLLKGKIPFVGVDGEGAGQDEHGRQHYLLLQAGERTLCTGKPLRTVECLEFLLSLPKDATYVGFAFGYDITMILRDLPGDDGHIGRDGKYIPSRREHLLANKTDQTWNAYTYWRGYGINWLPRNHFRVCRLEDVGGKLRPVEGSSRTIYETFGFFQKSFLQAVTDYGIGTADEHELLAEGKGNRGEFVYIPGKGVSDDVKRYCALECDFLARLMTDFRTLCFKAGLEPRTWNGAAKLSKFLHAQHGTITRAELEASLPSGLLQMAMEAYYGGRFEVTRLGWVRGDPALGSDAPVWEYDLRSAYPAAMRRLPCLFHGTWREATGREIRRLYADPEALFVAPIDFEHVYDPETYRLSLCGLPIRKASGLFWPELGSGIYWSVELRAAAKLACKVKRFGAGWVYERRCDCRPFDWVETLYQRRMAVGKDRAGYPLKLALNALYGLLAQRVGSGKFRNFIHAGLVTAYTRAALMDAAALDPTAIAMLATDAIISIRPLPGLPLSEALGDWEAKQHRALFIVQAGIYWGVPPPEEAPAGKRTLKTRGASPKFFAKAFHEGGEVPTAMFERIWADWAAQIMSGVRVREIPKVELPIRLFTGLKLAQARDKPMTAGCWIDDTREISFRWDAKRGFREPREPIWETPDRLWTRPDIGNIRSQSYDPAKRELAEADLRYEETELEQPDKIDFSNPYPGVPVDAADHP